jgi:CheY-like chemotaxis protein
MKFEVCIVDDDKIITLVHKKMVLKSNFHADPLSFLNGKDALDYILNNNSIEKTYCILLDINMPLMNGWEFLDAINQHKIAARILVFMITSSIDNADKEKAKAYPLVIDFLEKPISLKILEQLKKHDTLKMFFDPI